MTKKIAQYVVGKTAYKTRWAAETVATLINDGYIHDFGYTYARINHENLDDGFRIVYTDENQTITINVKDLNIIEVTQSGMTVNSEEILKVIKRGWEYRYDNKSIYQIPVNGDIVYSVKNIMKYFIKILTVRITQFPVKVKEEFIYQAHGQWFSSKHLAQIYEDVITNKELCAETHTNKLVIKGLRKNAQMTVTNHEISINVKLLGELTSKKILQYDELGYNWKIENNEIIWTKKFNSITRQIFTNVLRETELLLN